MPEDTPRHVAGSQPGARRPVDRLRGNAVTAAGTRDSTGHNPPFNGSRTRGSTLRGRRAGRARRARPPATGPGRRRRRRSRRPGAAALVVERFASARGRVQVRSAVAHLLEPLATVGRGSGRARRARRRSPGRGRARWCSISCASASARRPVEGVEVGAELRRRDGRPRSCRARAPCHRSAPPARRAARTTASPRCARASRRRAPRGRRPRPRHPRRAPPTPSRYAGSSARTPQPIRSANDRAASEWSRW